MDYLFPSRPALNPTTGELVPDATFQVFDPADTARATPLEFKDITGLPRVTLTSTRNAVTEPIFVTDRPVVVLKSGAHEIPIESFDGLVERAEAAATAAEVAQASSTAAAEDAAEAVALALGPTVEQVDTVVGTVVPAKYVDTVRPELYGAVGDGTTNDTDAFVQALGTGRTVVLSPNRTYLVDADALVVPGGGVLSGTTAGAVTGTAGTSVSTIKVRSTGGGAGITLSAGAVLRNLRVVSENLPLFDAANYPTGTGNATAGIVAGGTSLIEGVGVNGFTRGIDVTGAWARIDKCWIRGCDTGVYATSTDGFLTNSILTFCFTAGARTSNFWRIIGCRFEWNARYGVDSGPECQILGSLFDRNGWAGVLCRSNAWGQVISGNYFSRNGCGGDTAQGFGRWGVSIPSHHSWVATALEKSCHIQIDFQRAVTISGNRFRAGRDDSNAGASAPAYIYSSESTNGATGSAAVGVAANRGEREASSLGYSTSAYGGVGAIAGGTDNQMAVALRDNFVDPATGIRTAGDVEAVGTIKSDAIRPRRAENASSTTHIISVLVNTSGKVTLRIRRSTMAALATIYFATGSSNSPLAVTYTNHLGAEVTNAVIATFDATNNRITVTLGTAALVNWHIEYAN